MRQALRVTLFVLSILAAAGQADALWRSKPAITQCRPVERAAKIYPDYSETVIPPNIAPLDFTVRERGISYLAKIYSKQGESIEVFGKSPKIVIPARPWRRLLNGNRGEELYFEVFVQAADGQWQRFAPIKNQIASEEIDGFIVYRKMHPTHISVSGNIGIYQRNLSNFDESVVLDAEHFKGGCVNCHTFCRNRADKMVMGVRSPAYGMNNTLVVENGLVKMLGTKFGYTSWHPSGRLLVYAIGDMRLFWHTVGNEVRDTANMDSALVYYFVDSGIVKTSPALADKSRLETWPGWSPDGRYLYFSSAPKLWSDANKVPPERYDQAKYDIVRASYDIEHDQWGAPETVVSAQQTGKSALIPRISPDGRWLLFGMSDSGYFPAWLPGNDLYLLDLNEAQHTGRFDYRRLEINSDQSESWYTWSSNSRWVAFSSKRDNGTFTRCYVSYVDDTGKFHKPLIIPQKDPTFYESCLLAFNTPELIVEPVRVTGEKLARVVRGGSEISVVMPITMATPKAEVAPAAGQRYEIRE